MPQRTANLVPAIFCWANLHPDSKLGTAHKGAFSAADGLVRIERSSIAGITSDGGISTCPCYATEFIQVVADDPSVAVSRSDASSPSKEEG